MPMIRVEKDTYQKISKMGYVSDTYGDVVSRMVAFVLENKELYDKYCDQVENKNK